MMDIPKKIFNTNIKKVDLGPNEIYLFSKDEIEDAQIGFRIDTEGNVINDWIGDNYVVIGNDSCCGDPIITDLSNEKLPVYSMFHDDWNSLQQISTDFEQYIEILNKLGNTNIRNEDEKDELLSYIKATAPEKSFDYWVALIQAAYEFLNDID